MAEIKILYIAGSLHKNSCNHFALNAAQQFDQNDRLTDEPTRQFIQNLLSTLVQLVKTTR